MPALWWMTAMWWMAVMWWMVVVDVSAKINGISATRYVKVSELMPSGDAVVVTKVSSQIECGAVCSSLTCTTFTFRPSSTGQECAVYDTITSVARVTEDQEYRVYTQEGNVAALEALLPTNPRSERVKLRLMDNSHRSKTTECIPRMAVGGVVLETGDSKMSALNYFECRQFIYGKEKLKLRKPEIRVSTGVETPAEVCPENWVLVGFHAEDIDGNELERWINPPVMYGLCKELEEGYQVSVTQCEEVTVTGGPWLGSQEYDYVSWDMIIYCPFDTLAVQLSRQTIGTEHQIMKLRCCLVTSTPVMSDE